MPPHLARARRFALAALVAESLERPGEALRLPARLLRFAWSAEYRRRWGRYWSDVAFLSAEIPARCRRDGVATTEEWVRERLAPFPFPSGRVDREMYEALKKTHQGPDPEPFLGDALLYGERLLARRSEPALIDQLASRHFKAGHLGRALALRQQLARRRGGQEAAIAALEGELKLLHHGFPLPDAPPRTRALPGREVVYVLSHCLPWRANGYAARSHGLLRALGGLGWKVTARTRLGYPWDDVGRDAEPAAESVVDGVVYRHFPPGPVSPTDTPLDRYLETYADRLTEVLRHEGPAIVHAASNFVNGIAAVTAARRLGLPSIYEVRGLWEVSRLAAHPEQAESERFRMNARMEGEAACAADVVLTITGALRDELVARGVPAGRIQVLPNGVDTERFRPAPPDAALRHALAIGDRTVIGYVGSFIRYEGLDDLLRATARLRAERSDDFRVLLVGRGPVEAALRRRAESLGVGDRVIFTGAVPHAEVDRYYSLVDVAPFPRKPERVCEMVSPLKPFEAMAMGKAVLVSSVAALTEIVADGETGLVFRKGSVEDLAARLGQLLDDGALRRKLGDAGRAWVVAERDWRPLAARLGELYESLRAGWAPEGD